MKYTIKYKCVIFYISNDHVHDIIMTYDIYKATLLISLHLCK